MSLGMRASEPCQLHSQFWSCKAESLRISPLLVDEYSLRQTDGQTERKGKKEKYLKCKGLTQTWVQITIVLSLKCLFLNKSHQLLAVNLSDLLSSIK